MKNIVVNDGYRESDLKPSDLLGQYVDLLGKDVASGLANGPLTQSGCPACGGVQSLRDFQKFGLAYKECADCQSLYVSPRPSDAAIAAFYKQAPSKIFWRNRLSEVSRSQRKARIIKPRFEWVMDSAAEHLPSAQHWVDVHTGQQRYVEAISLVPFAHKTLVYPYCEVPSGSGVAVEGKPWWEAQTKAADIVTLFEVVDHTSDVAALMSKAAGMLNKGGLCFITAILASGLDIKELGPQAKNLYPPDRLNVLSIQGFQKLFARHGFECLEFSTPGVLDLDIVAAALREDSAVGVSPFLRDLALNASEDVRLAFQEFLQANMLSSYGRILIRKV